MSEDTTGSNEALNGNGRDGARRADLDRLLGELYSELRARAERFTRGQPPDWTLQATALANETYLKLSRQESLLGADRAHILALVSRAMRSVLVDHARARGRVKRLPPGQRVPFDEVRDVLEERAIDIVALDEALTKLADLDPCMVRAVDLHFFGGLSLAETASAVDLPLRTLERRWQATKAWLRAEIGDGPC